MLNRVVLLDLEQYLPTATMLRQLLEHNSLVFIFHAEGTFQYDLNELTEFASWVNSGQIVILDIPEVEQKNYEYAVLVGQLLALLEAECEIELMSAMPSREILLQFLHEAQFSCHLTALQATEIPAQPEPNLTQLGRQMSSLSWQNFTRYCHAQLQQTPFRSLLDRVVTGLAQQSLTPLQRSSVWLQHQMDLVDAAYQAQQMSATQAQQDQDTTTGLSFNQIKTSTDGVSDSMKNSKSDAGTSAQLSKMDMMHVEVLRRMHESAEMPKDIYQLRDLLEKIFPEADVGMLLKALIDKQYIYWNGHEVVYSHEMYLN